MNSSRAVSKRACWHRHLDGRLIACHVHAMADLQLKHVPDTSHQRLRRYAQGAQMHAQRHRAEHQRLAERPVTDMGDSAASLLAEERQERQHELA